MDMSKITVYRLERNHLGPFQSAMSRGKDFKPDWFREDDIPEDFIYGCDSLWKLKKYFINLDKWKIEGFEVKRYAVDEDDVRYVGDEELVFHVRAKDLVDHIELKQLVMQKYTNTERQFSDSIDI